MRTVRSSGLHDKDPFGFGRSVLALLLIIVTGCGRNADVPIKLRAGLPDNVVVIRMNGPVQARHAPAQWIVDRVVETLPGSRSAVVEFAGLRGGWIVEADCLGGGLQVVNCGEVGFASPEVLDIVGLSEVNQVIQKDKLAVAFNPNALLEGHVQLQTGESSLNLRGVHGVSSSDPRSWPGLPTVWIPDVASKDGMVAQPFAVVVATQDALTDEQHRAILALNSDVELIEEQTAVAASIADGRLSPDCVDPSDACKAQRAITRLSGASTQILTARSD